MKLLRVGLPGQEKPAILDVQGKIRDLSGVVDDLAGATLQAVNLAQLHALDHAGLPEVNPDARIGPCVGNVGKFICVGLNYADHAAEANMPLPQEPVVFTKWSSCICGPNDDIIKPRDSQKLDWEVELGIVIGDPASYVSDVNAEQHIAGYCLVNDISERYFQLEISGGQWDKGKSSDTFGPLGPWLVTPEEIDDLQNLDMQLSVNGKTYQDGNTRTMIFKPAFIVSYLSRFTTLQPGDIISTGTPPGVGMGQRPQVFLQSGDLIEASITQLGSQRQKVVAEAEG